MSSEISVYRCSEKKGEIQLEVEPRENFGMVTLLNTVELVRSSPTLTMIHTQDEESPVFKSTRDSMRKTLFVRPIKGSVSLGETFCERLWRDSAFNLRFAWNPRVTSSHCQGYVQRNPFVSGHRSLQLALFDDANPFVADSLLQFD